MPGVVKLAWSSAIFEQRDLRSSGPRGAPQAQAGRETPAEPVGAKLHGLRRDIPRRGRLRRL